MSDAKKDQGSDFYPGVDNWKPHILKAGTYISQLDYRVAEVINTREATASKYFTEGIGVAKVNNQPSAKDFAEQVQVRPYPDPFGKYMYPQNISLYEVKKDIPCEMASVQNNPLYGRGGASQFFINIDRKEILKEHLELKNVIPAIQRSHDIPLFKKAEEFDLTDPELKKWASRMHEEIIKNLEKGTPAERERAGEMRRLMQESSELKSNKTQMADLGRSQGKPGDSELSVTSGKTDLDKSEDKDSNPKKGFRIK